MAEEETPRPYLITPADFNAAAEVVFTEARQENKAEQLRVLDSLTSRFAQGKSQYMGSPGDANSPDNSYKELNNNRSLYNTANKWVMTDKGPTYQYSGMAEPTHKSARAGLDKAKKDEPEAWEASKNLVREYFTNMEAGQPGMARWTHYYNPATVDGRDDGSKYTINHPEFGEMNVPYWIYEDFNKADMRDRWTLNEELLRENPNNPHVYWAYKSYHDDGRDMGFPGYAFDTSRMIEEGLLPTPDSLKNIPGGPFIAPEVIEGQELNPYIMQVGQGGSVPELGALQPLSMAANASDRPYTVPQPPIKVASNELQELSSQLLSLKQARGYQDGTISVTDDERNQIKSLMDRGFPADKVLNVVLQNSADPVREAEKRILDPNISPPPLTQEELNAQISTSVPGNMNREMSMIGVPKEKLRAANRAANMKDFADSITGEDDVPAMLSEGEAVIPKLVAEDPKYKPIISEMVNEGQKRNKQVENSIMKGQPYNMPMEGKVLNTPQMMDAQAKAFRAENRRMKMPKTYLDNNPNDPRAMATYTQPYNQAMMTPSGQAYNVPMMVPEGQPYNMPMLGVEPDLENIYGNRDNTLPPKKPSQLSALWDQTKRNIGNPFKNINFYPYGPGGLADPEYIPPEDSGALGPGDFAEYPADMSPSPQEESFSTPQIDTSQIDTPQIETVNNEDGTQILTDKNTGAVVKEVIPPGISNKSEVEIVTGNGKSMNATGIFKQIENLFGFEKQDVMRALLYYAGGRLAGGSHGGSMRWAGKQVLDEVKTRQTLGVRRDAATATQRSSYEKRLIDTLKDDKDLLTNEAQLKARQAVLKGDFATVEAILLDPKSLSPMGVVADMGATPVNVSPKDSNQLFRAWPSKNNPGDYIVMGPGGNPREITLGDLNSGQWTITSDDVLTNLNNAATKWWKDSAPTEGLDGKDSRKLLAETFTDVTNDAQTFSDIVSNYGNKKGLSEDRFLSEVLGPIKQLVINNQIKPGGTLAGFLEFSMLKGDMLQSGNKLVNVSPKDISSLESKFNDFSVTDGENILAKGANGVIRKVDELLLDPEFEFIVTNKGAITSNIPQQIKESKLYKDLDNPENKSKLKDIDKYMNPKSPSYNPYFALLHFTYLESKINK